MTAKQERRTEQITKLIKDNKEIIYKLSDRHRNLSNLNLYIGKDLGQPYLRETLLAVYGFIQDRQLWKLSNDGYIFFVDTAKLTYEVRKKSCGRAVSNHHINLLCAIGLFEKVNLNEGDYERILKPMLKPKDKLRAVNAFKIYAYDSDRLQFMEHRSELLRNEHVTTGNISNNYLRIHKLNDIADEVYYANNKNSPNRKQDEWNELQQILEFLIDEQGYANKEQIKENSILSDYEIDRLFVIFKDIMRVQYNYKAPTRQQVEELNLESRCWIITRKQGARSAAASIGDNVSRLGNDDDNSIIDEYDLF